MRQYLIITLAAALGVLIGARLPVLIEPPPPKPPPVAKVPKKAGHEAARWNARRFQDLTDKVEVPCPKDALRILVLGQSNAANTVGERIQTSGRVFEWWKGKCYRAGGPMLGSEGVAGSTWPLVGEMLRRPVVFVGAAIGGTTVEEWAAQAPPGLFLDLIETPEALTHIVWMQGEADAFHGSTQADYAARLKAVIGALRSKHPKAAVLVALTSRCQRTSSEAVRAAQASLVDPGQGIFAGPDTDLATGDADRFDGCHLSGAGARKVAQAWAQSLAKTLPVGW